jgi:hypothetical protein
MMAALEEVGCQRFYVQIFVVDSGDFSTLDDMFDTYMGR